MEPEFSDGDHVLVKQQDSVDIGEIGIFAQGGEGYIKELGEGVLRSLNKKYPEIPLDDSSRCFGKVLGKTELV
jgi:SOS-response transcriptional repressor LexA